MSAFLRHWVRGAAALFGAMRGRAENPRAWSNTELRRLGVLFSGDVINVSAAADQDKQGGRYRDYFPRAASYTVSNYRRYFPTPGPERELVLDLDVPLADEKLKGGFDAVFSHTVLEHVFDMDTAVGNLCALSRDAVITVVPFIQAFHCEDPGYYSDYWRFTPVALEKLFARHGFSTLYVTWNETPLENIYIFHIASRLPGKWGAFFPAGAAQGVGPGKTREELLRAGSGSLQRMRMR